MEWVDGLNASIGYIENHLTEEIAFAALAKLACCSNVPVQRHGNPDNTERRPFFNAVFQLLRPLDRNGEM